MEKIYYQNDFPELPGVYNNGCLYKSLLNIISEEFKYTYSKKEIREIYKKCNDLGYLGTSEGKNNNGAFVWDHVGVLNTASFHIGYRVKWQYVARVYTQLMESKGYTSFVNDPNYQNDNNIYMIFQVRTTAVPGHFKRFNYDPWKMGSKEICLKSTRYYKRL
ncbi:MAG: hypothetical protein WBA74_10240 [Cyclobacteriaceae bacterium]